MSENVSAPAACQCCLSELLQTKCTGAGFVRLVDSKAGIMLGYAIDKQAKKAHGVVWLQRPHLV